MRGAACLRIPPHSRSRTSASKWLKYAALQWHQRTLPLDGVLRAGVALADLYQHIRADRWFTSPVWFVDVFEQIRVGWLPVSQHSVNTATPPELRKIWPMLPERSMVFVVGCVMYGLHADETLTAENSERRGTLAALLGRATDPRPDRRLSKLVELKSSLRLIARRNPAPATKVRNLIEEGIGCLDAGQRSEASLRFAAALAEDPSSELAREGLEESQTATLADLGKAKCLEADGWYHDAIEAYRFARSLMEPAEFFATLAARGWSAPR